MSFKDTISSKKFFLFNIILLAMVVGFGVGVAVLGLSGTWSPKSQAFAEEKPIVVPASVYDLQNTFRAISKNLLPTVVEVRTESDATAESDSPLTPPFDFFFGPQDKNDKNDKQPKKAPKSEGLGSGVLVERHGDKVYVLTNNHVTDKSLKITVKLYDGREFPGTLVGADPRRDLALVSFTSNAQDISLAKLGDSSELEVGDWVLAIGNPLGLDFSVTSGIVSAVGRKGGPDDSININSYIQTDASINKGNSGGALVNLKGEVVGINTWIASPNGASVGLGFAIPINNAKKPIQDFINQGSVKYGWLGASVTDLSKEMAASLGVKDMKGSFIPHVFKGSPAEKAGILPGDFVTGINGTPIADTSELVQQVGDLPIGKGSVFDVYRQGQKLTKNVVIEQRAKETEVRTLKLWPGVAVAPLSDDIRDELNIDKAVNGLVAAHIEERSTADIAGLKVGDVINKVNDSSVTTLADFYKKLNEKSGEVKLSFVREGVELSIGISR